MNKQVEGSDEDLDLLVLDEFKNKTDQLIENLRVGKIENALACINEINQSKERHFYRLIGALTRGLHEAINDLNTSAVKFPDAKNQTNENFDHIINLTLQATSVTLDMADQGVTLANSIIADTASQKELINTALDKDASPEHQRATLAKVGDWLQDHSTKADEIKDSFRQIILAQEFQDLTHQSITKAGRLIKRVEKSLLTLTQYANLLEQLADFSAPNNAPFREAESKKVLQEFDKMADTPASEHLDQGDVDDLLSSLGF